MSTHGPRLLIAIVSILLGSCENGPSAPTERLRRGVDRTIPGHPDHVFRPSSERLTKVAVGYSFSSCTGSTSLAPDVPLERSSVPVEVRLADYESAPPGTPNRMLFHFLFTSTTQAQGMVTFADFTGCGTANATWTAVRR